MLEDEPLTNLESTAWWRASTLSERAPLRLASSDAVDIGRAQRRLERWRLQSPFTNAAYFAQRLTLAGLTEHEFAQILGESEESLRARGTATPDWLVVLEQALAQPAVDSAASLAASEHPTVGFLGLIAPLVAHSRARLQTGVPALGLTGADRPFDPAVVEPVLFANLPDRLLGMLGRTLALELNVARLQGILQGSTPEERFHSFLQHIRDRQTALALLQEYPVLARQIVQCLETWVVSSLELLERLGRDWPAIQTIWELNGNPGQLIKIDSRAGDRHRGGRSVTILTWDSGFKLVYKPKALAVERHFQELLTWLNAQGAQPRFRGHKLLDRGDYGWVEYIEAAGCTTPEEVSRFYRRQGGYLAVLYALEATDFHYENLIAAGEHPMLVDLEALFHSRAEKTPDRQADWLVHRSMTHSVLRIGLLPQLSWASAEAEGIDLSGLGARPGQLAPKAAPHWDGVGTDVMRFVRQRATFPGGKNRPNLNGADINAFDHIEAICQGFTDVYRLLMIHREAILADDGPLTRFAADEVRVIVRDTQTYASLLQESFHPDLLRDGLERERFFDQLWLDVSNHPYLVRVIAIEQQALHQGDIPLFTTRPNTHDLWSDTGEQIPDFLDETGLALVRQRLAQFSPEDLQRQTWFIGAALSLLAPATEPTPPLRYPFVIPPTLADQSQYLAAAQAIGNRLLTTRLADSAWLTLAPLDARRWELSLTGPELYDGLPGMALFFANLAALTQVERYRLAAETTLDSLRRQIAAGAPSLRSIGGFDGYGGVIYTLTHLGVLWDQPALLHEAEALLERLPSLIEQDTALDILSGAAGCIGSLTTLQRVRPSRRTLEIARQCGERLTIGARPMAQGVGWLTPAAPVRPLTGFAHGAAGIAWSLLELSGITGDAQYRHLAEAAIIYERTHFQPEQGNWHDGRESEVGPMDQPTFERSFSLHTRLPVAWCYGAPGIGLARLCGLTYLDDGHIRAEIDTALKTTVAQSFGFNHCLCHGDLGNLDFLLEANQIAPSPELSEQIERLAAAILHSGQTGGWLCSAPRQLEIPGLMTGLAGIGYGLLRLAQPARVPCVLALAPP